MEIITHTSGRNIGQIAVLNTLATMEPGETWTVQPGEVKLNTAQIAASRYGADSGKQFHVSSPKEAAGQIVIKRIR